MAIRVVVQPKPKITLRVQPRIPPQEITLQNTGDWVQWKLGEGPWQDLIEVAELGDSAMYAGQAAQSALEAAGSALAAQNSASSAGGFASAAGDAQEAAEIAQGLAEQAVVDAGDAKDAAEAAQLLAETARGEAEGFKDAAQLAQSAAEDARDLALAYADEDEDVPVAPGVYSAKHWSAKASAAEGAAEAAQLAAEAAQLAAETAEGHAEGFKDEAELARDEAVGAAAGVNLPIIGAGDAGKTLVVTVAEDGYELIDPVAAAADVTFDPSGTGLSATDVQAALEELDSEKANSADLGGAASLNVGTVAGTVAAGDDSRFGTVPDGYITPAKMDNGDAVSVLGRSANSSGARADIAASANDRLLARVSNALSFTQLTAGMVPAGLLTFAMLSSGMIATTTEMMLGTSSKVLTAEILKNEIAYSSLTDASTIAWDFSAGNNRSVAIGGNRTLGNITNALPLAGFIVKVTATGSTRTLSLGNQFAVATGVESFPISITTSETVFVVGFIDTTSRFVITGVIRT